VAAPPLDLPCDGPVTYPGDIKTLRIPSKGRSGLTLNMTTEYYSFLIYNEVPVLNKNC
jgi:hypothetical protein